VQCVADGCSGGALRCFAGTQWQLVWPVDEFDLHRRHLLKAQDRITLPVDAGDALAVKVHLFFQRPAGGLDCTALDLIADAVRIDGQAAVQRDHQSCHTQCRASLDLGHFRAQPAAIAVATLLKLLLMPCLMAAGAVAFGISGSAKTAVLICAAVPGASSSYILARQLGGDAPLMANITTVQTLAAMLTMPLMLWVLAS
jgi:hypothetical protein